MFKRIKISLSSAPNVVYYIKDSWLRVISYLLFIPFLVTLPFLIKVSVNPSLSQARFEAIQGIVSDELRLNQTTLIDGTFQTQNQIDVTFDYFTIYIGSYDPYMQTVGIVFETNDLVMYMSTIEINRISYTDLAILDHDFTSRSDDDEYALAYAIKMILEESTIVPTMDVMLHYFTYLIDYLFYIIILMIFTMIFMFNVQIPISYRIKLSVYLTTIVMFVSLLVELFQVPALGILNFFVGYLYHTWAYRKMIVIKGGGPNETK